MKFFQHFLCFALLCLPASAGAAGYSWLTFRLADASEISVAAENLNMNYSDGYLLLSSDKVNQTLNVNQIKSMHFSSGGAGIETINNLSGKDAVYYTLSGTEVGTYPSIDAARESLPSGIYIGKNELGTFKVIF